MTSTDFTSRYQHLTKILQPWAICWNQSVLHYWPVCRDALPKDWWEPLMDWSLESLHILDDAIAGGLEFPANFAVPPGLRTFLDSARPLLQFPKGPPAVVIPEAQTLRMTAKKQHEIGAILPFLAQQKAALAITRAVDIGGGAGHLARTLATTLQLPMTTIDRDGALQTLGRSLLQKLRLSNVALEFVAGDVQAERQEALDCYFEGSCLSVGLHTCGPLAWTHLKKSQNSRGLLNFGCCYDRMNVARDCQQSIFAQEHPMPLTTFALFLATRGRRRTLTEFAQQEEVNTFRLALHLFLQEEGLAAGFVTVGDASRAVYARGFAAYAADRMQYLKMDFAAHATRAEDFIKRADIRRSMREFFLLNVVRNAFARPLEVLLLLDRALWLEEQGHAVELRQFFDHSISPRNLGIFAVMKEASPPAPS
jgi:hypothetical protein